MRRTATGGYRHGDRPCAARGGDRRFGNKFGNQTLRNHHNLVQLGATTRTPDPT